LKFLILTTLLSISSTAFAMNPDQCKKHVEENIGTFSVCYNSGTTLWNGKEVTNYTVTNCSQKNSDSNWKCQVSQAPWPSSDCEMEVVLDKDCYFNISTTITKEGREDI
jgi:hypothetical protein